MKILQIARVPVSVNHAYYFKRFGKRTMKIKTTEAKEFFKFIKSTALAQKAELTEGPIEVHITLYFKDNRRRDIDNYQKIMNDALTGVMWKDDSQIFKLITTKENGCDIEMTNVEVMPYDGYKI